MRIGVFEMSQLGRQPVTNTSEIFQSKTQLEVLVKQADLDLRNKAIFINVTSGVTLSDTAGDVAVAAAICSSALECPIPSGVAFIGEVGLASEL
ncbi:uncharacterized protein LOC116201368 [Punica granatum]|uniref:Uncharacterized protein LOC116201368 n=1 Tax=Punica granatum TaxID=22663 RepID=A0A6P8DB60_PUNGR|nr:uncharacterized protein LOC116201368 [Punica granatum]